MIDAHLKAFVRDIRRVSGRFDIHEIFRDFVLMSGYAMSNAVKYRQGIEDEYLRIVRRYNEKEAGAIVRLLPIVVEALTDEPHDFLGAAYMELDLGRQEMGQFFTPQPVADMMAMFLMDAETELSEHGFITVQEPACGAGVMVIAMAKALMRRGYNPQQCMWVQCIDIDTKAALMAYIQLSLLHIPAEVVVGNSLSNECRDRFYTLAHVLGGWNAKLRDRYDCGAAQASIVLPPATEAPTGVRPSPAQLVLFEDVA